MTAPALVIFAGIIIVILAIWRGMRWRYGGIIEKKDATIDAVEKSKIAVISALEARIELAKDQREALAREIESLNGTVATLQAQANANAPPEQLALTIVHVGSIVLNVTRLSEQLAHTLTGVISTTEGADIASIRGTVE